MLNQQNSLKTEIPGSTIERLASRSGLIFILFLTATALIWFSSRYAGFVTDLIGFEQAYDRCGFWNYYDCTSLKNLRFMQHLFSYILYVTSGSDTIYWYLLYCIGHALTAFSGYLFFREVFRGRIDRPASLAFLGAAMFLVSPYHNEVIVWKVCIQYCSITICALLALYFFLKDNQAPNLKNPVIASALMLFGIFSLEQIIILPLLVLAVYLFQRQTNQDFMPVGRLIKAYLLPHLGIGAGYFLLSKLIYGQWIMHYGSGLYKSINLFELAGKNYSYALKYLFLTRHWPHNWKFGLQALLTSPLFSTALVVLTIFSLVYLVVTFRRGAQRNGVLALMVVLFFISMLPVLQLYMTLLLQSEGDRLGYFSSIFIFGGLAVVLNGCGLVCRRVVVVLVLLINLLLALQLDKAWARADRIYHSFLDSFRYQEADRVFILSVPDNYRGILLFRIFGDSSGVKEALQYRAYRPFGRQISEVMHFNLAHPDDGTKVEAVGDSTLRVSFRQYGNWFWHDGIGASSRQNDLYKVSLGEGYYDVKFKNFDPVRDVIIYADSSRFKKFTWHVPEKN